MQQMAVTRHEKNMISFILLIFMGMVIYIMVSIS